MAQVEKKVGLLRKSSASKKPLKEKVVLMYDEIFTRDDPTKCNPRFWDELFLMKVNLEYLEAKLESLDGEELMKIKDNINSLFQHCIQALGAEHQIRVVNSLQTLCALIRGVHQKNKPTSGFDIINMLMGFDKAELRMKNLMESLDILLCGDGSESLKSLCLKLLLCLVTVTDNISQNTILEYVMINSIFEAILQILSNPPSRREHGYDSVVLLALLVNYRKFESVNPYIVKLSIVDDEGTLNGMGLVIARALFEYNTQYRDKQEENQTGFFSALTSMVGSMFIADGDEKISVQTNEAILLALYEAVHLNRNFITVLAQSHPEMGLVTVPTSPVPTTPTTPLGTTPPSSDVIGPTELPLDADVQTSNLLITFLKYSSLVMQDTKDEHRLNSGKLCLIILTCIAEDQYANAFLHDDNMNFRVNLHRMPMRHRKKAAEKNIPCRPLVCAVLDLLVEFIVTHMMKEFPMDLYTRCIQIVHKLLCYQKKCRVRLHYTWRELWSALINLLKFLMSYETVLLSKHNIFTLALMVVNLFNMFITYGDTFLPTPSSYDELYYEIIRMHQIFDNLYSMVLRLSTNAGQWKEPASKVTHALVNIRAIINHFNPKIESYAAVNHISQLSEEQVLEVVRSNYDTLTLKLQDGLDQYERYSEQHKEATFFKELVGFPKKHPQNLNVYTLRGHFLHEAPWSVGGATAIHILDRGTLAREREDWLLQQTFFPAGLGSRQSFPHMVSGWSNRSTLPPPPHYLKAVWLLWTTSPLLSVLDPVAELLVVQAVHCIGPAVVKGPTAADISSTNNLSLMDSLQYGVHTVTAGPYRRRNRKQFRSKERTLPQCNPTSAPTCRSIPLLPRTRPAHLPSVITR